MMCIPENCTEESNTDIMADTEAQLAGAKHLRSNAKIAIIHHTRTMKSAIAQERTTAAELEELIKDFKTMRDNLEEAHNYLMLMIPDEYLEQEAQQHEDFLALQNRTRYEADNKLLALGGSNSPSGATPVRNQRKAHHKLVQPHPNRFTPPTPARRTTTAPTVSTTVRQTATTPTSTCLVSGHPLLSTSQNSADILYNFKISPQPALVSNQDVKISDTILQSNKSIEVAPQQSDLPSGLQDSPPEQFTSQSSPRSISNQRSSASLDAAKQTVLTPVRRHTPRSSVANRLFNTEVTPQPFSTATRKSAGVSP